MGNYINNIALQRELYRASCISTCKLDAESKKKVALERRLLLDRMREDLKPALGPDKPLAVIGAGLMGAGVLSAIAAYTTAEYDLANLGAVTMICTLGAIALPAAAYESIKSIFAKRNDAIAARAIDDFRQEGRVSLGKLIRLWHNGHAHLVCLLASLGCREARQARYLGYINWLRSPDKMPAPWDLHEI
ncbi:MAG: hypothetical protein N3H30_01280 [Candidatus Micrarchaeota archaeon]|nr:hypothetical protein [Candidatus Micrarchaeota archaeon]